MPFLLICGKEFKFLHEDSGGVFEAYKGQRQVTRVRNGHGGAQMETGDE